MNWSLFIGMTLLLVGSAAWMTGRAVANSWSSWQQVVGYSLLLGFVDRFLLYALYQQELLSVSGYLLDTAVILLIGLVSFRVNLVNKMVKQYPWLYRKSSWFSWCDVGHSSQTRS